MNASKALTAAIAAATIVGAVGFVSAQTQTGSNDPAANSSASAQMDQPSASPSTVATPGADMSPPPYIAPAASDTPADTSPTAAPADEPAPKADRN